MSTAIEEAIYEPEDEFTPDELARMDHCQRVAGLRESEVWEVACAKLAANPPWWALNLVEEEKRGVYPTYQPQGHPSDAQRMFIAVLQVVRTSLDELAEQREAGRARS